ncbi:MAG: hypothetical protein LBE79_00375 [Tannerella sp.]|jgi:hypothetical protein|nr:hypothetical protein [Tannerella sp.]
MINKTKTLPRFCKWHIIFLVALTSLFFSGCGKTKEARAHLTEAKNLYENQQYEAAKIAIDTIRLRFPREIAVLKESLALMRLVERGQSERNIFYCDSLTPIRMEEAEQLKKGFKFEKNPEYQDVGNYVWQQMTIERNVERSYIRCGVDEKGEIYLASVYFGSKVINHTGLKLSTPDGAYAVTISVPYDGGMNYRFKDMGNTTEVVTYKSEKCIDAVNFVYGLGDKIRIKAEYTGGAPFSLYLSENDKQAIRATSDLAAVLSDIEAMRKEKERSLKIIMYLDERLAGETK